MDPALVGDLLERTLATIFTMSAPVLFVGLAIGVLISIVQAATQINEVTLVFIPKMLGAGIVMWLTGPWVMEQLQALFRDVGILIAQMAVGG